MCLNVAIKLQSLDELVAFRNVTTKIMELIQEIHA